ncbi:autotransporter outer membrane beta-barrel domain-containing protein [Candidatus Thioglobus sp.]|nr:autotransporter outer membrane beta-barrel domain-containing protein [Candidatus Thioglobus sp.]
MVLGWTNSAYSLEVSATNGLTLTEVTSSSYTFDGDRLGKLNFTSSSNSFYLTDFSEIEEFSSNSTAHTFGIAATPTEGYDATINLIAGYGHATKFDIKDGQDDSTLTDNFRPEPEEMAFQPLVRIDYDNSNNLIVVSYDSDDNYDHTNTVSILSTGSFNKSVTFSSSVTYSLESSDATPPTTKADVVGSIEAWTSASSNWVSSTFGAVANRLSWLDRNQDSIKTSHQGIKIHFENEVIDTVMNLTPRSKKSIVADIKNTNVTPKAIALLYNTQSALVAGSDKITSDAQMIAVNEAARLREGLLGSLNPSFGSVLDDWSMWTAGEISIGKTDETSLSSEQKMDAQTISLGFDKPTDNEGLLGVVLSIGKSNTDIGTSTTNVKSDNYALSTYRVFKQDNKPIIETVAGLGRLNFDTTRKDGSETLTGARNANQVFAAVTAKGEAFEHNNWSITPYGKASLAYTKLEAFSESGGATALTYDKQTLKETKVYIGTDMNYLITINNGTVKPFINLEYSANLSNGSDATMHYSSESTDYTLNLDKTATNSWKLGLGADIYTKDEWNSSISYERTEAINAGYSDSLAVKVRLKF